MMMVVNMVRVTALVVNNLRIKNMKKLILTFLLATISTSALAMTDREAIKAVHKAASTEFCGFEDEMERVIRTDSDIFVSYSTAGSPLEVDDGRTICSVGSGTGVARLAHLYNGQVQDIDLFEKININTRFIDTDTFKLANGILIFKNQEFGRDPVTGEGDPNCCAADIYLNKLDLHSGRLISRKFVGRASQYFN